MDNVILEFNKTVEKSGMTIEELSRKVELTPTFMKNYLKGSLKRECWIDEKIKNVLSSTGI